MGEAGLMLVILQHFDLVDNLKIRYHTLLSCHCLTLTAPSQYRPAIRAWKYGRGKHRRGHDYQKRRTPITKHRLAEYEQHEILLAHVYRGRLRGRREQTGGPSW